MPLSDFLTAANLDIDETSWDPSVGETVRYAGAVIIVLIEYSNFLNRSASGTMYTYKVLPIIGTEYKTEEVVYTNFPTQRVINNRHGIRLLFIQTGEIGQFNFQILLLTLVSGLALIAASTTLVDILAIYFMPQKANYYKYKYTKTVDFSDLRDGKTSIVDSSPLLYGETVESYIPPSFGETK